MEEVLTAASAAAMLPLRCGRGADIELIGAMADRAAAYAVSAAENRTDRTSGCMPAEDLREDTASESGENIAGASGRYDGKYPAVPRVV